MLILKRVRRSGYPASNQPFKCHHNVFDYYHIPRREVYPIPSNMKEAIKAKTHLSKVVQDPASNFFKVLKDIILNHFIEIRFLFDFEHI